MDILLDSSGDLQITPRGDISLGESVAQKIRIKILWFEGEWRWENGEDEDEGETEGLPYLTELFVKNPDTDTFESLVREKIFEVEEVTEVKEVLVNYDRHTRIATIRYTALTDFETIKEEVKLDAGLWSDG